MKNKTMHIQLKISDPLFQRICAGMKEISAQQRNPFTDENRVLQLYAANPMLEPREIGELFTSRYGALHNGKQLNGDGVIRMLRLCRLANPKERTEVLTAADKPASIICSKSSFDGITGLNLRMLRRSSITLIISSILS